MRNKYPGKCVVCGSRVEVSAGEVTRTPQGWVLTCAACPDATDAEASAVGVATRAAVVDTSAAVYTLLSGHEASPYQRAVFEHFETGRGSAIVKAVAGSGKTSTMKNAVRYLPHSHHVQLLAFNTEAAAQLQEAIVELEDKGFLKPGHHIRAGTFHSVGMGAVRRQLRSLGVADAAVKVESNKTTKLLRAQVATTPEGEEQVQRYGSFVANLVSLAKGEGISCLVPDTDERWWAIIEHHGLYLDSEEATPEAGIALARRVMGWSEEVARQGWLDFDDQLYLVVRWKLRLWRHHEVVVDEAQDTNPIRRAIAKLLLMPGGRLYAVGDPMQSIYGFTGASTDAMDLIASEFNCRELPLTVSYRCAKRIVERAQTWVPYIEAHAGSPDGQVSDDVPLAEALTRLEPADAVLCRNTAPLVSVAYALIARGRACRILGREIGDGLVNLIEQQKAKGIDRLVKKLDSWCEREVAKFTAKGQDQQAEAVADRVSCIMVLINGLPESERTIPALVKRIQSMFSDPQRGQPQTVLTLCTVHKAKGREWDRVVILRPDLMPSRAARQDWQIEQEYNLMYVAATRAKSELIYAAASDTSVGKAE